jgi:hypothetical protein
MPLFHTYIPLLHAYRPLLQWRTWPTCSASTSSPTLPIYVSAY